MRKKKKRKEECLPGIPFFAVYGKREGHPLKPDPASVYEILMAADIAPERCIYFGDSGVDMQTACYAGCYPMGVTWGFRDMKELRANGAKRLLHRGIDIFPAVFSFLKTFSLDFERTVVTKGTLSEEQLEDNVTSTRFSTAPSFVWTRRYGRV